MLVLALPGFAHAHEEAEHHWETPAYIGEVRLQLAIMTAICVVWGILRIVLWVRRSRRCG